MAAGNKPDAVDALVRAEIRAREPYTTPPAAGLIKLDAMESPHALAHSLPRELREQYRARLTNIAVNRYPDSTCANLKSQLRKLFSINAGEAIVLGNGSDELIQMIALLVGGRGRVMLAPTPTFAMYALIATATGAEFIGAPLGEEFNLDETKWLTAIEKHRPACVFIAYPNNPSGNCFDAHVLDKTLERAPGLVVLDEAYFAFCRRSFIDRLARFPNLIILRTLSKTGLAGLRLGVAIAHPRWAMQLEKIRLPYNINSLTQCAAEFYLEHYAFIARQSAQLVGARDALFARLAKIPGVRAYHSDANFILFKVGNAPRVHNALIANGVLIKNLHGFDRATEHCLRVTIGADDENEKFIAALAASL